MPFQYPSSLGRQLLARGTLAVTLVGSLALYHQSVLTDRVTLGQRYWRAYGTHNPIASRNLYCRNKIILSRTDGRDRKEQGEKIRRCWLNLFRNKKI
ncbi:hypothetical protein ACE1CI_02745 [Aerosakkonemataceae cyanobacterium BLCC-F50]|uniref:Uncharacterized protein n=1 Tax=Floridaenema flaviceps BLCC-F50 TaxID=3153642 RepID=A0ABV4XL47_9CYAN